MRSLWIIGAALLMSFSASAQSGFRVGYQYCIGNAREINRVIYIYNQTGNFTDNLDYLTNARGLTFTWVVGNESKGFEMRWENRHKISSSNWMQNSGEMQRDLKFRQNNLSLNFFGGSESFFMGSGFGFGSWKGWTRWDSRSDVKDKEYEKIFVVDEGYLGFLSTTQFVVPFFMGFRAGPIGMRFTYQWQVNKMALDNLDNALVGRNIQDYTTLEDRFSNFAIEVFIHLGE